MVETPVAQEAIRLDNDVVMSPVRVQIQGYEFVLDPQAYTVEMEILLDGMQEREAAILAKGEGPEILDEQRRFLAGLLAQCLHAPQHVRDGRDFNPGWDAETCYQRLNGRSMGRLINFFAQLGQGQITLKPRQPSPDPSPPSSTDATAAPSAPAGRSPRGPAGARSSTTSSPPTPPTPTS